MNRIKEKPQEKIKPTTSHKLKKKQRTVTYTINRKFNNKYTVEEIIINIIKAHL